MTEPDWLAATDPTPLVACARGRATGRQLAMAAIALCRSDRDLLRPGYSRDGIVWAERVTDGEIAPDDLGGLDPGADHLMSAAANRCRCAAGWAADGDLVRAHDSLAEVVEILIDWDNPRRLKRMAEVCRDVFGNPFRPAPFSPAWRTEAAVGLARHMYRSRKFAAMPILADALQDAGCDSEEVLNHCRGPGPHVRGCWVVDLVLGKQGHRAEPDPAACVGSGTVPATDCGRAAFSSATEGGRVGFNQWCAAEWPVPACEGCAGARFTPIRHWRGRAVESGTAWGLTVRCDSCGTLWAARLLMSRFVRDGEVPWARVGEGPFVSARDSHLIRFAYLLRAEVAEVAIRWDARAHKSPELLAAAVAAGFMELEAHRSPVGVLDQDLIVGADWLFLRGARALVGMDGNTLVEAPPGTCKPESSGAAPNTAVRSDM